MKTNLTGLLLALLILSNLRAVAVTRYVDLNSPSPTPPYTSWSTAATNINDAIDAASDGELVLVTNGVYHTGGRVVYGSLTNRVAVNKPLTLQSVNGPAVTVIQGSRAPGATNGDGAIRCVYLTNGAVLSGFTLTNGATRTLGDSVRDRSGGGLWCESVSAVVSNCVLIRNTAYSFGGGLYGGTLFNCTLTMNLADRPNSMNEVSQGGGAHSATLNNCTLAGNVAYQGGGACGGTLNNCLLIANKVRGYGGGASSATLNNCTLQDNEAFDNISGGDGGGAYFGTLNNCTLTNNLAGGYGGGANNATMNNCTLINNWSTWYGGGTFSGTLNNCTLIRNGAYMHGGGAYYGTLNNCTLTLNYAQYGAGGGANLSTLRNCIIYFNSLNAAGHNFTDSTLNFCCTTPLPSEGLGNFTNAPAFIDIQTEFPPRYARNLRLQTNSPCINAGFNGFAPAGPDMDGNLRIVCGTVDIGAFEFQDIGSLISYAWLQQYGLPINGAADFIDSDTDGMSNYGEWRSDTIPTNALSVLRIVNATNSPTGTKVTWQSASTRNYWLERATNLDFALSFESIATNIVGATGTKTYTDTSVTNGGPYFYRVGVQ